LNRGRKIRRWPSARTLVPAIMYLPMRNGLANTFSTTSATDPTAGMRLKF
jgi:hypothetical protein